MSNVIAPTKNLLEAQWHSLPVPQVVQQLESSLETGLTSVEAEQRYHRFGANELVGQPGKSAWMRFLLQFNEPLIYILLAAGAITAFLREWVDAGVIFAVTIINAIIGFVQESKAENALAALAESVSTEATVIREGQTIRIPSEQIVPGDLVSLAAGDKVPADLWLIDASNLTVDESGLTGESIPVEKDPQSLTSETALAERSNMAYAGSLVAAGQGQGLVVATANATETGRISQMLDRSSDTETPITRKISKFSKKLLYVILSLAALVFAIGLSRSESWVEVFVTTVAFAVAAIPEGLPAIVTITLAIGVSRLADRNAIMRKLAAVETLGSTTVICSDKTGTLTENQMTVQGIYAGQQRYTVTGTGYEPNGEVLLDDQPVKLANTPTLEECLRAGLLCNDSYVQEQDGQYTIIGDPTEGALIVAAQKAGLTRAFAEAEMPRLAVIPFDSQFQYMATLHQTKSNPVIYVKGSMEAIFKRCEHLADAQGQLVPFERAQLERRAEAVAKQGLRILAFAKKSAPRDQRSLDQSDLDRGLILLGLQGMIDPPRTKRDRGCSCLSVCRNSSQDDHGRPCAHCNSDRSNDKVEPRCRGYFFRRTRPQPNEQPGACRSSRIRCCVCAGGSRAKIAAGQSTSI